MKKFVYIILVVLLANLIVSCYFPGYKLKPGDKIGGMEFINEYESCPAPNFSDICGFPALVDGTCEIPASMSQFWVSTGWAEDTVEELELTWLDSVWNMTFDGQKIDLPAFGTFDMDLEGQKARTWNVCISNPAPGKHTVRYDFSLKNGARPGNHARVFIFTVTASDQAIDPSLSTNTPTLTPLSSETMIEPGEYVGDFLITRGEVEGTTYVWNLQSECVKQGNTESYTCKINTDTKMNVSWGIYDDTLTGKLDEYWSNHTYEMYIEGWPVNLQAFGSIDVVHPQFGPMRHWNVVIVAKNPGEITVYSKGVAGGDPFEGSTIYDFSVP